MNQLNKSLETPEQFLAAIPINLAENVDFRMNLHSKLEVDKGMQTAFLDMCRAKPQIAFNSMFFTLNPKRPAGYRNVPFIVRPAQSDALDVFVDAYHKRYDVTVDKSREEGATEIICKYIALMSVLEPETMVLVGSRKAVYVDSNVQFIDGVLTGVHTSLFHKICYTFSTAPRWFLPKVLKTYMHMEFLENGSCIDGETTNMSFGAGDRRSIVFVDEIGRVDHNEAASIIGSISDTCDFNIFNSTHWYGAAHPYNKLLQGNTKIVVLPWERNPEKNKGMYRSPDYDIIEIKDIDYYKKLISGVFDKMQSGEKFTLSALHKDVQEKLPDLVSDFNDIGFVADGGDFNDGGWRSAWYDSECIRRDYNKRNISQNIDRNPIGSGDSFFSIINLRRIRVSDIRTPNYVGELKFVKNRGERVISWNFKDGVSSGTLKLYTTLIKGKLDQLHNYIISCDISRGTGTSNSVAQIIDANTCEQVGVLATAHLSPEGFADLVAALYNWVGGASGNPYLIWEANGPGQIFTKRILFHGITKIYVPRDENARVKKRQNKYGWWSTPGANGTKYAMLENLDIALCNGNRGKTAHKYIIIHDVDTLDELENYVNFANGTIGPASSVEDSSGARATHGDRVIGLGLAIFALTFQTKAVVKEVKRVGKNTVGRRMELNRRNRIEAKQNKRFIFER